MLRRTLVTLTGFLILSLVLTVAYALMGLGGPEHTIHRSQRALGAGDFLEAIRLADVALRDRALASNRELRRRALRVRYQAYARVGDYRHALKDLAELIETLRDSDVRLVLSRIQITLDSARRSGDMSQGVAALERARKILAQQPEHPQALALAGDACRTLYEDELRRLQERLRAALSPRQLTAVMAKLTDSCCRSPEDPRGLVLDREVRTILPERKDWHLELRQSIRTWVERGREYFLRALRQPHPDVLAYLGLDDILKKTRRDDQRLALAEIYWQRATPTDAITAAAVAAKLHLDAGRYLACVRTADRVLAPAAWRRLAKAGTYSPQIQPALLAKHLALARLGDTERLRQSSGEAAAMATGMPMEWPLYDLIQGVALAGANDRRAGSHLGRFANTPHLPTLAHHGWSPEELWRIAYETWAAVEQRLGTSAAARAKILQGWSSRDPRDPRPLVLTARLWLEAQQPALAVAAAAHALRLAENDEDVLALYAETAQASVAGSPRDLPDLLERCLRLNKPVPDNIGDLQVLALPLADLALRSGHLQIAAACAQQAADNHPWARWPRYLRIEAALAAGRPEDATPDLEVLLRHHPGDRRANELLSEVLEGKAEEAKALRYAAAVYGAPNLETARFLARRLHARGEWDRVLALSQAASRRFPPDPELMSLAARVLLNRGQDHAAGQLLAAIHAIPRDKQKDHWALGQLILWNPTKLSLGLRIQLLDGYLEAEEDPQEVYDLSRELRAHGEHRLAHRAAAALVRDERFRSQRTGAWFQLAGRAALQVGRLDDARDHLVAATGFGDGKAAALDLTLLHLAQNDLAAAKETFVQSPRGDLAAACVAARLGQQDAALAKVRYRLEADPGDLPSLCLLACVDPEATVPKPVRALAQAAGDELLELLAFLASDAFFGTTLRRATALAREHPKNPVAVLLGLRAFVRAGMYDGVVPTLLALRLKSPLLLGEALRILNASDSPELRNSRLMSHLLNHVLGLGERADPALLAIVIRHDKQLLGTRKNRVAVLEAIADFWIRYSELAEAGLDEVDVLAAAGLHKPALKLLEVIEARLPESERPRFLRTFYEVAPMVVAAEPDLAKPFIDRARKILTEEGPHGTVLHFLLEASDRYLPDNGEDHEEEILFLRAHVERYHAGLDQDRGSYLKSLQRLFLLEDPEQSLHRIEQTLRDDPSLLDLWGYRARRLVAANELDRAIDGLRWIPAYLEDPATEEILLPLQLRKHGRPRLESSAEPGSALARGLLALHEMDFEAAAKHLAEAKAQVDGSHLFYLAVARVGQGGPGRLEAAARCFRQLAEEYPASALAFLATEFAAQCEP